MTGQPRDLTSIMLTVLVIGALILCSLWVFRPFLPATIWAVTIVVTTWPLLLRLQAALRRSRAFGSPGDDAGDPGGIRGAILAGGRHDPVPCQRPDAPRSGRCSLPRARRAAVGVRPATDRIGDRRLVEPDRELRSPTSGAAVGALRRPGDAMVHRAYRGCVAWIACEGCLM